MLDGRDEVAALSSLPGNIMCCPQRMFSRYRLGISTDSEQSQWLFPPVSILVQIYPHCCELPSPGFFIETMNLDKNSEFCWCVNSIYLNAKVRNFERGSIFI